jgi:hypothetical protein
MAAPATGLPIKFQEVPRALSQPVHPKGTGAPGGEGEVGGVLSGAQAWR